MTALSGCMAVAPVKILRNEPASMRSPGDMVAARVMFSTNAPFALAGRAFTTASMTARAVVRERLRLKGNLADRHGDVAVFVELELDSPSLHFAHRFRRVFGHGPGLRVRHQAARPEHFAELSNFRHARRRGHRDVEVLKTADALLDQILVTNILRACFLRSASGVAFGEIQAHGRLYPSHAAAGRCRGPSGRIGGDQLRAGTKA